MLVGTDADVVRGPRPRSRLASRNAVVSDLPRNRTKLVLRTKLFGFPCIGPKPARSLAGMRGRLSDIEDDGQECCALAE
jgi:hypothetical protein